VKLAPRTQALNRERPVTPLELHEAVHDMRYEFVMLIDRDIYQEETFSLDWIGMSGMYYILYCRDRAEVDAMTLRLCGAGFDGEISEQGEKKGRKRKET
jgi:hypothetical protein